MPTHNMIRLEYVNSDGELVITSVDITSMPIIMFVNNERNLTLEKLYSENEEYIIKIDDKQNLKVN